MRRPGLAFHSLCGMFVITGLACGCRGCPVARLDDRMDSYFLSETAKYLFLLFDTALLQSGHLPLYANRSRPHERLYVPPVDPNAAIAAATAAAAAAAVTQTCDGGVKTACDATLATRDAGGGGADAVTAVDVVQALAPTDLQTRQWLASLVRSNRSRVPALPFDLLHVRLQC